MVYETPLGMRVFHANDCEKRVGNRSFLWQYVIFAHASVAVSLCSWFFSLCDSHRFVRVSFLLLFAKLSVFAFSSYSQC